MLKSKLLSRKLGAFLLVVVIVIANYAFNLNMPNSDLMALVASAVGYILGQGYVDAKTQPIGDIATAITDVVQSQVIKLPIANTLPMDELHVMFEKVLEDKLSKVNVLTLVTPGPVVAPDDIPPAVTIIPPVSDPVLPAGTPDIVAPAV